ncbi:MAG: hypothetical protein IH874_03760 [Candidatus Dadabacteria bacterium]|nr:hypothetical protein [Candidatus Dadabacteria bacterium]
MTKLFVTLMLFLMMSTSIAFGQGKREITIYDPLDAIHPFKLLSLIARPPLAILNIFVRGGYYVLDSQPTRRAFNIEFKTTMSVDEDY